MMFTISYYGFGFFDDFDRYNPWVKTSRGYKNYYWAKFAEVCVKVLRIPAQTSRPARHRVYNRRDGPAPV